MMPYKFKGTTGALNAIERTRHFIEHLGQQLERLLIARGACREANKARGHRFDIHMAGFVLIINVIMPRAEAYGSSFICLSLRL